MSQVRRLHIRVLLPATCLLWLVATDPLAAQGYDDSFEMKSKLKVELQYADYSEYEYPEPILFSYGKSPYTQNDPYIVNFPERRYLLKFTHLLQPESQLGIRFQYSDIKQDCKQYFLEGKITRTTGETTTGFLSAMVLYDTRKYSSIQGGIGMMWEPTPLTSLQGDVQYYYRGAAAVALGGKMGSLNVRTKLRQVLTLSTAIQGEYTYYNADGDAVSFTSHTMAVWLSQFLPTQTAVHTLLRYYTNSLGIRSFSPSVEVAQVISWSTVLWLKFRYYTNESDNVSFGEEGVVVPDGLISRSYTIQLNQEVTSDMLVYGKFRYYNSSLSVAMNTYMLGVVYEF
jgi:hypothetical protein